MSAISEGPRNPFYDANDLVRSGWAYFQGLSSTVLSDALNSIGDIASVTIEPIVFDANFEGVYDPGTFVRPTSPGQPPPFGSITTAIPEFPGIAPVNVQVLGDAPAEPDFSSATYTAPSDPGAGPGDPNIALPTLDEITLPDPITLPEMSAVPELYPLAFPEVVPTVTVDPFDDSARPTIGFDVPTTGFTYAEREYTADLALAIKARMAEMLVGGTGLPVAIEQALFDRSRDREDREASRVVQEVTEEFATRGFSEPNGILGRRLLEVRQENQNKAASLNRDLTIQRHKEEIEAVRFAVAQGLACEQLLIEQTNGINARALQAAQVTVEWAFKVYEARVSLFNAQLEAFKTDAQVYVEKIRAKQQEVDIYRAQIDAEKAKGEVNESLLRAYTESIRARDAMVQVYRTQVEAARVAAEVQNLRLERTRTEIGVFEGRVRAFGEQVNAYRATVEGRLGHVRAMEAMAGVYASRIQAYRTKAEASFEQVRAEVSANEQVINAFRAQVEGASTRVRAEAEAAQVAASNYRARADIYQAEGQIEIAAAAAYDRQAQIRIEGERARVDSALKGAEIRINQALKIAELLIESLRGRAQAQSQLAASVLNGVNLSAGISGSASQSDSFSISLSGEI